MSETNFQKQVTDLMDLFGWRWHHETDSRKSKAGWLDLLAVRAGHVVVAELKTETGVVEPEQAVWLAHWRSVEHEVRSSSTRPAGSPPAVQVFLWRPSDIDEITRVLR